jgi:hypothetical protein
VGSKSHSAIGTELRNEKCPLRTRTVFLGAVMALLVGVEANQLTSPGLISPDLLKQLCHTCSVAFDVMLVLGALLVLYSCLSRSTRKRCAREALMIYEHGQLYVFAGFCASQLPGLGECTLLLCKSNIARSSSFSLRPLPVVLSRTHHRARTQ